MARFLPYLHKGLAALVVEFDEGIVRGDDLNVYVAESTQRGTITSTGPFGEHQRMVYFKHDGSRLFITIVAPGGISDKYLQVYVMHPRGLAGDPGLSLLSSTGYDVDGNEITTTPRFTYHP